MSVCVSIVYTFVLIVLYCCVGSQPEVLIEESSAIEAVHGPTGGAVELPCDVTPALPDDRLGLVIWYKQGHDTPIYSFDIREGVTSHWSDPSTLAARATFRSDTEPAVLVLTKLRPEDSGQYRCRVDFIKSPTKNTILNLTVLIPPERLIVLNQEGDEVQNGVLGPYDEGTPVNLTCIAVGGRPRARVSWWKSHALLANSEARATVSFMLQRSDHAATMTCQAVTDPSIPPISEIISIDVNLPVLWLRLQGGKRPLVAGQSTELVCQAVGARPKPSISWWKDGTRLKGARDTVSTDGNVTRSVLTLVPSLEDAGRVISCRAVQPALPQRTLEDGWKMEILHIPVAVVSLGGHLVGDNVVERSDVYLDCAIKANPPHTSLYFTHNGVIVKPSPGVLLTNQSLVLQKVSRQSAGEYRCVARNNLGDGTSDALKLDVKYTPTCSDAQPSILRAAIGDLVEVECNTDANPKIPMSYQWWFNSSSHGKHELPGAILSLHNNNKLRNYVYMVNSSSDYGWLQCSATNSVGRQHTPCLFQILPADKPAPVKDCAITNVTYDSLTVNCTAGRDGGIPQAFLLQITDMSTGILLYNMSHSNPRFIARGLQSSNTLSVRVIAYNKRGGSEPTAITATLLNYPQKYIAPVKVELSSVLMVVVASVAALVTVVSVAVAVCFCARCHSKDGKTEDKKRQQDETSNMPLTGNNEAESVDSLDKNPDIIPQDSKTNDSCSNKSSTTDYSSIRPLISERDKYDILPNSQRYYDHSVDCTQYNIRPIEYSIRPTYQPIPNLGPSIQSIGPSIQSIGPTGLSCIGNECHRQPDKVFEDWLKYKNSLPLNSSGLLQPEQLPPELYPPPSLYSNPRPMPLIHMPEIDHRYQLERHRDSRSCSSSPPVRFQDSVVYFDKSMVDKANTLPDKQ